MIGRKVYVPKFKENEVIELIYFYLVTSKGNERLSFNECVKLLNSRKVSVKDIGIIKQWVVIQEVICYGPDKYGYVASADLHTNKLNILIAHNQYPNYEYRIKDMDVWKVFYLNLTRGCKPAEHLYETLDIVKELISYKRNIPRSFVKKILGQLKRSH